MKTSARLLLTGSAAAALAIGFGTIIGNGGSATAAPAPAPADAKTFAVDSVHSNVIFKIKHMNVSNFYGRFNKVTGSFTTGDTASINVTVDANSVDTNNSKRDDHVKSPDFFSAKEFGEITFVGKDFKKSGEGWKGSGELTFHGVKKTIEVDLHLVGSGPGMGGKGESAGVETSFTIKRSDYGLKGMVGPLGDDVTIWVSLEGGSK